MFILFYEIFHNEINALEQIFKLNLLSANPTKCQTHSSNSSAISRRIIWVCLTILWNWRLKG